MDRGTLYATRSGAVRAARNACKRALGDRFCAYEGPDYEIHPDSNPLARPGYLGGDRYYFRLRGPALEESEKMSLINVLKSMGFERTLNGGNCYCLVRVNADHSDVITDLDGGDVPAPDDWLWVRYTGDWRQGIGEEIAQADSQTSTRRLIETVTL